MRVARAVRKRPDSLMWLFDVGYFIQFLTCLSIVIQSIDCTFLENHAHQQKMFQPGTLRHTIRPNFPERLNVTTGLFILSIDDLDLKEMTFDVALQLRQEWTDHRLIHDHYPYIDAGEYHHSMWLPDTYFVHSKKASINSVMTENLLIRIYPSGKIVYSARLSVRIACTMDLRLFPMDTQHCPLSIESYAHTVDELVYKWDHDNTSIQISEGQSLAMYVIGPLRARERTTEYVLGVWSTLVVEFEFIRKTVVFVPSTYFPCGVIVMISWITFVLDARHYPARTYLNVISILTIITLQSAINYALPKVSYVKVIDEYILACILFVCGSFVEYALILVIMDKKNKFWRERKRKYLKKCKKERRHRAVPFRRWSSPFSEETQQDQSFDGELSDSELLDRYLDKHGKLPAFYLSERWPFILDEYSRVLFPIAFLIFNVYYIYYCQQLHISSIY